MRRLLLMAIAVLTAFSAFTVPQAMAGDTVPAGALVIAPNGNDSNPCTASAPCATFQKALTSGRTFVARGGTYTRDESFSVVDGSRLLEYPGEVAVHAGRFWVGGGSSWEIEGVGFTWGGGLTSDDHMVKITGGSGWRFHGTEVWGARSWANVLITGAPDRWRFDHNEVHDVVGSPSHNGVQDHNVYLNTETSTTTTGSFDHNLLYAAPHGENLKADGTGGTSGGAMGVDIAYNTMLDAKRTQLIGGTSGRNHFHHNVYVGPWQDATLYVYSPQPGFSGNTWAQNVVWPCPGAYIGASAGLTRSADVCADPQLSAGYSPGNSAVRGAYGHTHGGEATPARASEPTSSTGPVTGGTSRTGGTGGTGSTGGSGSTGRSGQTPEGRTDSNSGGSSSGGSSSGGSSSGGTVGEHFGAAAGGGGDRYDAAQDHRDDTDVDDRAPTIDATGPSAPSQLSGCVTADGRSRLDWSDVAGAVSYRVYEPVNSLGYPIDEVATSERTSGVLEDSSYHYLIRSVDASGNESPAAIAVDLTTPVGPSCDDPALGTTSIAPTELTGCITDDGRARLDWTDMPDASAYNLYSTADGASVQVDTLVVDGATTGALKPYGTYHYLVRSVDASGQESTDAILIDLSAAAGQTCDDPAQGATVVGPVATVVERHQPIDPAVDHPRAVVRLDWPDLPGAISYVILDGGREVATSTRSGWGSRPADGSAHHFAVRAVTADGTSVDVVSYSLEEG